MKCKACKNEVPDGSLFCMYCGEKLVKSKAQKKKEISVPKPRQQKSGEWIGQIMVDGERYTVKGRTVKEYEEKAIAIKTGYLNINKNEKLTLRQAMRRHIDVNENVLSPDTIRTYEIIIKHRFKGYMDKPLATLDYQEMINDAALEYAPKTVSNSWGLVTAALNGLRVDVPDVNLPKIPKSDRPFLDYEEIKIFVESIKGHNVELAALLALHGLRVSEIIDLDVAQIHDGFIYVRGATVRNKNNESVHKETNKTHDSTRLVPIIIDRVLELLPASGKVVSCTPNTILKNVKKSCVRAGVTFCGTHDLRRSFCSLAYHLKWNSQTTQQIGGWANLATVEEVYRKLAAKEKNDDVERMRDFYSVTSK